MFLYSPISAQQLGLGYGMNRSDEELYRPPYTRKPPSGVRDNKQRSNHATQMLKSDNLNAAHNKEAVWNCSQIYM